MELAKMALTDLRAAKVRQLEAEMEHKFAAGASYNRPKRFGL
jgi:hypothetical protein